ncbi:MAG: DEAD/DEAH box helicase [Candidatus Altiarchaeota archaeon]
MYVEHRLVKPNRIKVREYQERIFSNALEKNTLVVLPTGLGKTIVALLVAVARVSEFPQDKVLFLAPTKPLAVQHKRTFDENLVEADTALLTGTVPIAQRKKLYWAAQFVFATPQTIENDFLRGLSLKDYSLIIFDEAHRASGDYSYVRIARKYMSERSKSLILALTASPSSQKEKIDEICANLFIEQIEAKTETDVDVRPYVQETRVEWVGVVLPEEFKRLKEILESILRDDVRMLKVLGYLESAELKKINKRILLKIQSEIRGEITDGADSYGAASVVASALKVNHALELLETQGVSALHHYLERLSKQKSKAVGKLLSDPRFTKVRLHVQSLEDSGVEHPKLGKLLEIVQNYKGKRVLVFTQYRDSVEKIVKTLADSGLSVHEFVGQAARDYKRGMTQKKQVEILENFRDGLYDVLVATSVAEEGLDIPKVDLVVFYEPIPSEIRSIQRRGRTGRSEAGEVKVLISKGTRDEGYLWAAYHKEKKMSNLVKGLAGETGFDSKQQSIMDFTPKDDKGTVEVKVFVDVRERNSRIAERLGEKCAVELKQLEIADYILSDRVAVERKTVDDFLQSIVDRRLFNQASEMVRNFPKPVLIIEGNMDFYSRRDIHANAIRGAIASLAVDYGIPILPSQDEEDTAEILYTIAKREQIDENRIVSLRGERKPWLLEERQIFVIESLPNVSGVLARRLLAHFGSVNAVFNASEDDLTKVEGIGKKKADEIRKVTSSRYTHK